MNFLDKIAWAALGPSWAENCRAANISYYVVIPLDPHTSKVRVLGHKVYCVGDTPGPTHIQGALQGYKVLCGQCSTGKGFPGLPAPPDAGRLRARMPYPCYFRTCSLPSTMRGHVTALCN